MSGIRSGLYLHVETNIVPSVLLHREAEPGNGSKSITISKHPQTESTVAESSFEENVSLCHFQFSLDFYSLSFQDAFNYC